ncbi:unnamed protein product [Vitrella brassicaformis CCMP3155]|uniref:Uncharacterized protein n=1 Tax=Vitrella brassicaformis (strain CCMP3155) TaxID=1169540 RepID=A0A0G4H086_VITBC|nr:unnamed protein product [Vitrella brassicaformis CCMP3155]|eukprot:CEM36820.1 unnamed protein product [Vitrella brassicaformis CCMP3155]
MAAAASSSSAASPQAEAMASPTPCRYKEGSRVQMVTSGREKGKQRWVKADVYRLDQTSGAAKVSMREVGGREEFRLVVPHSKTNTSPHDQQAHGGFRLTHKNSAHQEDYTMAPRGLGDDHLTCVFSFMTPRELSALPTLSKQWPQVRKGALRQQTHIDIDCSTEADSQFWYNMTTEEAFQLGKKLVNLTALSLVQPYPDQSWYLALDLDLDQSWCLGSMISVVEGHADGRREAREKEGHQHMAEGSLETIEFTTATTTITTTTTSLPLDLHHSFFAPPPTLPALRAVTGAVREHRELADRGWKMPALEYVDLGGLDHKQLGRFIRSSSSLKEVGGRRSWGEWATLFEHFPVASAGRPGPLRRLRTIGGIARGGFEGEEVRRLQDVLSSRGCREALTSLDVEIPPFKDQVLEHLLAVDDFINTCCVSPDVPLSVEIFYASEGFELSLFYADDFPSRPSPFIKTTIQEAARRTSHVSCTISQDDITHPIHTPSQAAIEIASSLSFECWGLVVRSANGFGPPPGTTPPTPAIIEHLQPFPRARELRVYSPVGGPVGRLLAEKMPMQVGRVWFDVAVSAQDRIGVLEALGAGREVGNVRVGGEGDAVSLTQGGPFDGWGLNRLPSISNIGMRLEVPQGLEASAAADIIRDGLSTLLNTGVRGLRRVAVELLDELGDLRDAIREVIPYGTRVGGFTIDTREHDDVEDISLLATRGP